MGFFDKIKQGLSRTKENIGHSMDSLFSGELNDDFYDGLEETLILSDMGVDTSLKAAEELRRRVRDEKIKSADEARDCLRRVLCDMVSVGDPVLDLSVTPSVILVIGVNGVGKTTTIGKLGARLKSEGKRVLFAAADTFRAAAADQLEIWSERSGADLVRQHEGADPAAVVFDAMQAAKARRSDVVLVDTAGRLHNKQNLMNELTKIGRVIDRELPGSRGETLLVLDATTGQNGLIQAKQFMEAAGITGIVLTKLDGTAKGGIVIAIADTLGVPVKYIGVGEGIDDLMPFQPEEFIRALIE
ncbi:MAG: signal recognition particle-docking protein FtsY [Pseudoflavonifractor sp.]